MFSNRENVFHEMMITTFTIHTGTTVFPPPLTDNGSLKAFISRLDTFSTLISDLINY